MISIVLALLCRHALCHWDLPPLRRDPIKLVLGFTLLSYGINFVLFSASRMTCAAFRPSSQTKKLSPATSAASSTRCRKR